jgi:hypothetical protein
MDQQRLLREVARLTRLGADPLDAVRRAVLWSTDRLEFGTTHALAGAPDWLSLYDNPATAADEKLAALGEILGHIAEDGFGQKRFPFHVEEAQWDEAAFLAAIEREDEAQAIALARGALRRGLTIEDLLPTLLGAALAHYADFGHSLIYTIKTAELARHLGPGVATELLLLLTRSLVFATREDLLPEFSTYGAWSKAWGTKSDPGPALESRSLRKISPKTAMGIVATWSGYAPPERIFAVLVEAAAWLLLHVDEEVLTRTHGKIADNVGWLGFTHALTFAAAGQTAARLCPELWPAILLQLACFIGRNSTYADAELDTKSYAVPRACGQLGRVSSFSGFPNQ